jgi:hypothetical protein
MVSSWMMVGLLLLLLLLLQLLWVVLLWWLSLRVLLPNSGLLLQSGFLLGFTGLALPSRLLPGRAAVLQLCLVV